MVVFRYPALDRCAIKAIFGGVVLICTSHQKPSYKFNAKVAAIEPFHRTIDKIVARGAHPITQSSYNILVWNQYHHDRLNSASNLFFRQSRRRSRSFYAFFWSKNTSIGGRAGERRVQETLLVGAAGPAPGTVL